MALKIFKYPIGDEYTIMPVGAKILSVQEQNGVMTAWAIVDDTVIEDEQRYFMVVGTGWDVPNSANVENFITTVQSHNGLVWHIFEYRHIFQKG